MSSIDCNVYGHVGHKIPNIENMGVAKVGFRIRLVGPYIC